VIHALIYTIVALLLLTSVGNWACRMFMNLIGLKDAIAAAAIGVINVGRYIGALERLIIAIGLVAHSWEAIAAVIALKTIGRFKELDTQLPAEYFLVGSLFSVAWAIGITAAWVTYDHFLGVNIAKTFTALLGKPA
jgi:hypothetical protein